MDLECPELFPAPVWSLVCIVLGIRLSPFDKSPPITATVLRSPALTIEPQTFVTKITTTISQNI